MKQVINLTQYKNEVENSTDTMIIKLGSVSCAPCKMLDPILDQLESENSGKTTFVKVDVDQSEDISQYLGAMSIPLTLIYHNGQIMKSWVGFQSKQVLNEAIKKYI